MQSLMIVEDEKMIRQGIRAMVQRSGVHVGEILECSNGMDALGILSERHVDVLFTDIRMQKMDGIELVRRINDMKDKPLIVAISGYDDFTYAVEMLRNGVREYILKPVERGKIASVLKKLNDELEQQISEHTTERELGIHQIRELVENRSLTDAQREMIIHKYEPYFYDEEYRICIFNNDAEYDTGDSFFLEDTPDGALAVLRESDVEAFMQNEMSDKSAGLGGIHMGLSGISEAYKEASLMRKLAFIRGKNCVFGEDVPKKILDEWRENARKYLSSSESTKRVQILGTDKTDHLIQSWKEFFTALEKEILTLPEFSEEMEKSITQILEVYRESITDEDLRIADRCRKMRCFEYIGEYQNYFMDWILDLNKRVCNRPGDINIRQKIAQARQYVEENFASDLNMAVVSNYVSMNYSLFSYSFKQYTGQNFVNYLKEIRIARAKELLSGTDLKIIEISQMVGYENEKNFMKVFKSLCGVTPGEYRKNMFAG